MKKYLVLGAVAAMICACGEKPSSTVEMVCGDHEVKAKIYGDKMDATIGGQKIRLIKSESTGGAKYESDDTAFVGTVLWNKDKTWTMIENEDAMPVECVIVISGPEHKVKVRGIEVTDVPTPTLP